MSFKNKVYFYIKYIPETDTFYNFSIHLEMAYTYKKHIFFKVLPLKLNFNDYCKKINFIFKLLKTLKIFILS